MHKKGSILGLLSGLFWGLDSVVLGFALLYPVMIKLGPSASLLTTFLHDAFAFLLLLILIFKMRKIEEFKRVIKSKSGFTIFIAALLGGPLGMGGYILAINYLGSTLASSISAIYPAAGVLLAYLVLKERMKKHSILGILVAITAVIFMGISPDIEVKNLSLGLIFIFITIIGWGSEAVIINVALKENVSSEVALAIRQLTSMLIYGLIVMPIIGFSQFSQAVQVPQVVLLVVISGILGTFSYLSYYKSIDLIGATQAMGLNITYPAWAFIFQFLLSGQFDFCLFALSLMIMLGAIMSNDNPKEVLEILRFKSK